MSFINTIGHETLCESLMILEFMYVVLKEEPDAPWFNKIRAPPKGDDEKRGARNSDYPKR